MIKDLTELAALAAVGGTLVLAGCDGADPATDTDVTDTDAGCPTDGCPTDGCPTDGCPTDGCPTGGCPTATSGYTPDYATNGDFFTMQSAPFTGTSPHGTVWMYYSETLRSSIEGSAAFTAPVGASSIKEVYDGANVDGYVVMTKQAAGYDADNGDWHYEVLDASGNVTQEGALDGCIACHAGGTDTDYLLGTDVSN